MPEQPRSVFWDDVELQLEDPEFRRHFVLEQNRIETVDRVMNLLMDALEKSGTSRADVARAVGAHASAIRRLLNRGVTAPNPTLETLADVAAVLGFQVELVPMDRQTRRKVTDQLTRNSSGQTSASGPTGRSRTAPAA
ncbi:MAG TPA: helix-turn-helix transcriptional regulator [Acidimicrobiales bacterium]|nr:helix-turn-helix transcriptional regulator [Acidimicrobiales bacterium]